jgi:ribosomal protein S6--L-glutamate ligase
MDTINMIGGWQEWVSLPELHLPKIKAKIDTGALTSSLHAYNIKYVFKNGIKFVTFEVHPLQRNNNIKLTCEAPLVEYRKVKSSSGIEQKRPVILTLIKIGSHSWPIEINLTNRDSMGVRMLIGRQAIKGKFLVNPSHKFLHGKISTKRAKELYSKAR